MNMNDKEWNEFWDNEPDEDDEFNDAGSDVDANNDETFDNAAEWDEDEHEELIARDSILSHTIRNSNNRQHHTSNSRTNANSRISGNNNNTSNNNNNNSNNNNEDSSSSAFVSNVINSAGRAGWNSLSDKDLFPALGNQEQRPAQTTSSDTPWQNVKSTSERLHLLQLQQQQLLMQNRLKEQQHQESQQLRERQILQQQRGQPRAQIQHSPPPSMDMGRQILRVDELESQLLKTRISHNVQPELTNAGEAPKRTGWSPFGGKDLFTTPDSASQSQSATGKLGQNIMFQGHLPPSLTLEQQQQILMQQQHLLQQQHQLQQMAVLKQQQIQQEQRLMSQNPQCFTVEELERQMIPNRSNNSQEVKDSKQEFCFLAREEVPKTRKPTEKHDRRADNSDQRNDRFDRNEADVRDTRDHRDRRDRRDHRDHREYREHREYRNTRDHRNNKSKKLTIIPPQVQLSVLDKAKRFHSLTAMHSDEFLQDRMPTSKDGLLFKRHSTIKREKANHDGVLTERERNWLTKIQEKIQADYDDNMDQDYYYLLYFNRSSMTDEAAQKPCGPGVLDRRFIPRERLLYNSSA